jgi:hypothetical protein
MRCPELTHAMRDAPPAAPLRRRRVAFRYWSYSGWYLLTRPWLLVSELWCALTDFIMRGWYGYSETDLWNLDEYLSSWLPAAFWDLSERGCGYPPYLTPEQWRATLRYLATNWPKREAICHFADVYADLWD